jgi:magnesium-transporting ATPase (P-type)
LPVYARAVRDAQEARISAEELVPGDVVLVAEGDRISADARLVEAIELRVDQSTLTGESTPVIKSAGALVDGKPATDGARQHRARWYQRDEWEGTRGDLRDGHEHGVRARRQP